METEGFLSSLFAGIAYNLEKKSLRYHCSASASVFGQESLDHILLCSFHNGGLCKNEAEELSKKSEESSAIYAMRDSKAVHSLGVPCTPLQTINFVPKQLPDPTPYIEEEIMNPTSL